ncbi:hypothetical protein [Methylobacterium sp. Leaf465]|uniref:hypothetical protein n=1 Tax=Methylobacterium sp. Leaf465 TaxID=1736385 RepID=UPI000A7B8967|nr:hypothetical protein [Methylobacterium sp. Leaf465]
MSDVTTIIRVHDLNCIDFLQRALFSLSGQKVYVDVIIATQRFLPKSVDLIKAATNPYVFGSVRNISILNSDRTDLEDLRSHLINISVKAAKTRYIHFLDFDDIMYPSAYNLLIDCLNRSSAAISFGAIVSTYYERIGGKPYVTNKRREFFGKNKYDLFVDNFCPIHSFLIDLSKVDVSDVLFDENMSALEDYSFLLSFLSKYQGDFSLIDTPVGEYFRRDADTINLANSEFPDPSLRVSRLEKAREIILEKKRSTRVEVRVSEFAWLLNHRSIDQAPAAPVRPLPQEEKAGSDKPYQINEYIGALFASRIVSMAADCREDLDGYVDSVEINEDGTIIKGWVDNYKPEYQKSFIFFCSDTGTSIIEPHRYMRADVDEAMRTNGLEYGFEFSVPRSSFDIRKTGFAVYLAQPNKEEVYRIRMIESLPSEYRRDDNGTK